MVKPSAPIQEVARLLDLVPFLSSHSHISLKELASEFGVSEKEMANELTALSMCGLPGYTPYELIEIYFESGFVSINNHDSLDIPRALTNVEVASLLIGLALLREAVTPDEIEMSSKIDRLSEKLNLILGSIIEVSAPSDMPYLALISRTIAARASLSISYHSPLRDEVEERLISPLAINHEGSFTYINSYCHSSQGYRNFRSDRISAVSAVETQPKPTSQPLTGESEKVSVNLSVLGRRRSVAEALTLSAIPANGVVATEVYSTEWIEKMAIAFSPDVVLDSPTPSRNQVKSRLEKILALYLS